ncbi:SusD/RagB family nutrient-binding outer membrane lipoprotein [Danxiaibacter flavus]|uniref:SusD/RagB family nutrient-binding outer membrane lipoprotein n=1 Tax=Danxiaibacter flavus TaxID=3049108 RepID=A0ABV3ZEM5_9BACT|nr:SusD/RagB family nutrient-binding outer membrane lipoprotein [Chitinophagaceae bacterium DXS]
MKILYRYISLVLVLSVIWGCKKSEFAELYPDPDKNSNGKIESLFANMLIMTRYHMQYWDLYTFTGTTLARYTQMVGYTNDPGRYQPSDSYVNDRWNKFYTDILPLYRQMEAIYKQLPDSEKKDYKYIMGIGEAVMANEMSKVTDLWGDVPYSEGGLIRSSDNQIIYPKYESQKSIYTRMLSDLKDFADTLAVSTAATATETKFLTTYDFVNKGDLLKWQKFINSLRLRWLVRVKNTELSSQAIEQINEILNNPAKYPLIESNDDNAIFSSKAPNLLAITNQHEGGPKGGFAEVPAGKKMLDILKHGSFQDPRLQTIFSKNSNGEYAGIDPLIPSTSSIADSLRDHLYSYVDSATYRYNDFLPAVLFTASEVHFLKAELRSGSRAEDAFRKGIKLSIEWYYYIRNLNEKIESTVVGHLDPPSSQEVTNTIQYYVDNYFNNLDVGAAEAIGIQRWIHFGHLQMYEAWADIRRFDHPHFSFVPDNGAVPNVPKRIKYPSAETINNTIGMSDDIKAKDLYTNKVWWDED